MPKYSSYGASKISEPLQELIDDNYRELRKPKKVLFYRNGDHHFKGRLVQITPHRYITFNELLGELTQSVGLPYGVRRIYTPEGGSRVYDLEDLKDGDSYVCASFERFKKIRYASDTSRSWGYGSHRSMKYDGHLYGDGERTSEPYVFVGQSYGGGYRVVPKGKNTLTPLVYTYPQGRKQKPGTFGTGPRRAVGSMGAGGPEPGSDNYVTPYDNFSQKPKVIKVVRADPPRRAINILLNRKSVKSYEQLLSDISSALDMTPDSKLRKLFNLKGRELRGLGDFFRTDNTFVATSRNSLQQGEIFDIIEEVYPNSPYAKRTRIKQVQQSKNDSGFSEDPSQDDDELRRQQERVDDEKIRMAAWERDKARRWEMERKGQEDAELKARNKELGNIKKKKRQKERRDKDRDDDEARRRAEEEERRRKQAERERMMRDKQAEDERKRQAEDDDMRRRRLAAEEAERRRLQAEQDAADEEARKRREDEERMRLEEQQRLEEEKERRRLEEEEEERRRLEEEERRRQEEERRKREEEEKKKPRIKPIPSRGDLENKYILGKTIGDGNFAVVKEARMANTENEFAIKIIDKSKVKGKQKMVDNEIDIMFDCDHPNIVKLYDAYESPDEIFLVMELVKGGDLFDAITESVKFTEHDAALMVSDLLLALDYLHSRNIVHRDIKPENLLVHRDESGRRTLKLADFGLAMPVKAPIYTVCGTPTYVAPEILSEKGYGIEVDMWATGVISYILLCGFPPFRSLDRDQDELFDAIQKGEFEYLSPYWDNISKSAKEFIDRLIVVHPKNRWDTKTAMAHNWIKSEGRTDAGNQPNLSRQVSANLEKHFGRRVSAGQR